MKGVSCNGLKVVSLPRRHFKSSLLTSSFTSRQESLSTSDSSNPLLPLITFFSGIDHSRLFTSLDRRNSRVLTSLLVNKAPRRTFLFRIGKSSSPQSSMSLLLLSSTGQCTYPLSVPSSCLRTPQTMWLAPVAYSAGNPDLPTCYPQVPQQYPLFLNLDCILISSFSRCGTKLLLWDAVGLSAH